MCQALIKMDAVSTGWDTCCTCTTWYWSSGGHKHGSLLPIKDHDHVGIYPPTLSYCDWVAINMGVSLAQSVARVHKRLLL